MHLENTVTTENNNDSIFRNAVTFVHFDSIFSRLVSLSHQKKYRHWCKNTVIQFHWIWESHAQKWLRTKRWQQNLRRQYFFIILSKMPSKPKNSVTALKQYRRWKKTVIYLLWNLMLASLKIPLWLGGRQPILRGWPTTMRTHMQEEPRRPEEIK